MNETQCDDAGNCASNLPCDLFVSSGALCKWCGPTVLFQSLPAMGTTSSFPCLTSRTPTHTAKPAVAACSELCQSMNSYQATVTAANSDLGTLGPLPNCLFYRWTAAAKACGGSGTKTVSCCRCASAVPYPGAQHSCTRSADRCPNPIAGPLHCLTICGLACLPTHLGLMTG